MAVADSEEVLSSAQQEQTIKHLLNQSIENILHGILLEVHQEEKVARMQTAILDLEIKAERLGHTVHNNGEISVQNSEPIETKAAVAQSGSINLRGNPMKTVKYTRCPNCRLPRLLYPRVGFNARPPPDPAIQYCKNEPMIIIDKHDVHGQRKKGVKVKGQAKGKNKKLREGSPASSIGDPMTPSSSMPDSFEFKEIDFPAAKCPNRNSHLGDHWKAVNLFATHLNGSCWLKRDRAAMREANAKLSGTPKDSRASSPKPSSQTAPATTTNGVKRKAAAAAAADEKELDTPILKKKQKTGGANATTTGNESTLKKTAKKSVSQPSKLREQSTAADNDSDTSPIKKEDKGDTIHVSASSKNREHSVDSASASTAAGKLKFSSPGLARKKPGKLGKKS